MKRFRIIPVMMIDDGRAVITQQFKKPVYVGDPINAIKIFNDKEVDELFILDITDKRKRQAPDYQLIAKMASESFMPVAYGGHIQTISQAEQIINCGIEKISFNTALFDFPETVSQVSERYGKQSVVASVDIKNNIFGSSVVKTGNGSKSVSMSLAELMNHILKLGVGEILLTSIDKDGSRSGFDYKLIEKFKQGVGIPIVACGGAGSLEDFRSAIEAGASAVAAGAMFFFKGSFNAVLINYPDQRTLKDRVYYIK